MSENDVTTMEKQPEATGVGQVERTRSGIVFRPLVDVFETEEELTMRVDLPGAKSDEIDIRFENGVLTLDAEAPGRAPENAEPMLREYEVGDFHREFRVGEAIDASKITADYHAGVLTLHLPKSEAVKPRRIDVKTHPSGSK